MKLTDLNKFLEVWKTTNFRYDLNQEGTESFTFGAKAGPDISLFNLTHEVAHFIQFSNREFKHRTRSGSMTFKTPTRWCFDRFVCEPLTDKMSRRELETFVIQYLIHSTFEDVSLKQFFENNSVYDLFSWLPDCQNFHSDSLVLFGANSEFRVFVDHEASVLLENWSTEKIKNLWLKRLEKWS